MLAVMEGYGQKPTVYEVKLSRTTITNTCESIFEVMLDELPEETHSMDTFDYILSETKSMIHSKLIKLQ